jgi:hypothetical protein
MILGTQAIGEGKSITWKTLPILILREQTEYMFALFLDSWKTFVQYLILLVSKLHEPSEVTVFLNFVQRPVFFRKLVLFPSPGD